MIGPHRPPREPKISHLEPEKCVHTRVRDVRVREHESKVQRDLGRRAAAKKRSPLLAHPTSRRLHATIRLASTVLFSSLPPGAQVVTIRVESAAAGLAGSSAKRATCNTSSRWPTVAGARPSDAVSPSAGLKGPVC